MGGPDETTELEQMEVVVEHVFAADPARVWALLTDVGRMAAMSPEVVRASVVDEATFTATNRRGAMEWTVTCHVLEATAPTRFEWCVSDPAERSSTWSYDLEPVAGSGTRVRQRFRHGPGRSMVRAMIEGGADPAETVDWRARMLAEDMAGVLAAADALLTGPGSTESREPGDV